MFNKKELIFLLKVLFKQKDDLKVDISQASLRNIINKINSLIYGINNTK
jgi:hypothetical protein